MRSCLKILGKVSDWPGLCHGLNPRLMIVPEVGGVGQKWGLGLAVSTRTSWFTRSFSEDKDTVLGRTIHSCPPQRAESFGYGG